jgi:hypothetical protein
MLDRTFVADVERSYFVFVAGGVFGSGAWRPPGAAVVAQTARSCAHAGRPVPAATV